MQGFLELKVKPWKRAIITRSMALLPTLLVAIHYGGGRHEGLDSLNGYLNVLQSMVLRFAVVPLLTFAGAKEIMHELCLPSGWLAVCWIFTALIIAANTYLLTVQFAAHLSTFTFCAVV